MHSTCNLIIGMHRSGTSLLASLVDGLGVELGTDLHPADEHNATGYYEDRICMQIQERMLLQLGYPWHGAAGMQPFPDEWWRRAEMRPLVGELESWIDRRVLAARHQWAVKDPRTTRFIPMWRELLEERGVAMRFLLAIRDPAEVVTSEVARDRVPVERVFETWLRYNSDAALDSAPNLAGVFSYDRWFGSGLEQLRQLAAVLGVDADDERLRALLSERVSSELYHARAPGLSTPSRAAQAFARLEGLVGINVDLGVQRCVATELEYLAAVTDAGDTPQCDGPLSAIIAEAQNDADAWALAVRQTQAGMRSVVAFVDAVPEKTKSRPSGVAAVGVGCPGPRLEGSLHVRASYRAWQWLQRRHFSQVNFIGGQGLAATCLDARRQGLGRSDSAVQIHYNRPPCWLDNDGAVRYHGVADVEAHCLEARVISGYELSLEGDRALLARFRQLAPPVALPQDPSVRTDERPLVTVCVTHHDRPALLQDCVASVRALTYPSLECVLVDDGSTSATAAAVLAELATEFDGRGWRLIRQENRYLGAARNAAARVARGKYLFFLDDDNLLRPDGLDQAVDVAERTDAAIVTAVMAKFSGPAGTTPTHPQSLWVFPGASAMLGVFENCFGDANALVRRDVWETLGGFTEHRGLGLEDWEFFARATLAGCRLEHCLVPVSWYRVSETSMARTGDWWRDYQRALGPYRSAQVSQLESLPSLAGVLQRRVAELEPFKPIAESRRIEIGELEAIAESRRVEVARLEGERVHLAERLAAADAARAQLTADISALQHALNSVTGQLYEANRWVDSIYRSSSWRITAPLRALKTRAAGRGWRKAPAAEVRLEAENRVDFDTHTRGDGLRLEDLSAEPLELADFSRAPVTRQRWAPQHPDLEPSPAAIERSVAVVIPTKNAGAEFRVLLKRLRTQCRLGSIEIIVVDSGSTDSTVVTAREFDAHVIEILPEEFSHSYARNLGAQVASAEYLLFMVQDALPIGKYWLHGMLRYREAHASDGLVAVSCAEFSRVDSDPMYDCMIETHYEFLGCLENDRLGRLRDVTHESLRRQGQLSDVACLIPREQFMTLRYRGDYGEDLDLGIRLIKAGWTVAMMASIKALHSHNRSALYYLKRSYVDVAFLRNMFEDFPIPPTLPIVGMIAGALAIGTLLTLRLDDWTREMIGAPMGVSLSAVIDEIRGRAVEDLVEGKVALGDEAVDEFAVALRRRFSVTKHSLRGAAEAAAAQRFLDLFLGRVSHFAAFAGRVYGTVDPPLADAARGAITKAYAASLGAALGFAYQELAGSGSEEDRGRMADIAGWLKAGV